MVALPRRLIRGPSSPNCGLSIMLLLLLGSIITLYCAPTTAAFAPATPVLLLLTTRSSSLHRHKKQYNKNAPAAPLQMISAAAAAKKGRYTLTLWPILQKFKIGPQKAKEIFTNVVHVTDWQDIVLLCFLAFAISPAAQFLNTVFTEQEDEDQAQDDVVVVDQRKRTRAKKLVQKEVGELKRFGVLQFVHRFARVALAVYAVDVLAVIFTTLGFTFPTKWHVAEGFAKAACELIVGCCCS